MYNNLGFPLYDGKETITQFIRRVNDFELLHKKPKYDIILEFINALINSKYSSLTEFNNIPLYDITMNIKIVDQYVIKLANILNIDILELTQNSVDIINLLHKILNSIGYSLIEKKINNQLVYSIKNISLLSL